MRTIKRKWLHLLQLLIFILVAFNGFSQLHADFTARPITGCPPMVVSFQDSSTGNPTSWKWDLGNGTTSYLQNPIATYFNPGSYTIKLVVKSASATDSIVKDQLIVVNSLPVPKFSADDTTGCFPLNVQFKDSSLAASGNIASWQWDFGDGNLSTQQNPLHVYNSAGSYTVTLRITNSSGCGNILTKPAYIKLQDGVKADFTFVTPATCHAPTSVTFTNQSTGTGALRYSWDFGDGNSSSNKNPINTYSDGGIYSVKLIATSSYGCTDTITKTNAVHITSVKADFTKPDSVCAGSTFSINNTSSPATINGNWFFGDGSYAVGINTSKTYAAPGLYQVKLVNDFGGCIDSITKPILVVAKPVIAFTATNTSSCSTPLTVTFNNTSTGGAAYFWDFGDGATSTAKNPVHTYTSKGKYAVTLIVTNATGCADTLVKADFVKIVPPAILSVYNLQSQGCIPLTVKPTAVLVDNQMPVSYFWSFGDGSTSTDSMPSHTYTTPGAYDVKLVIKTASGCADSVIIAQAVKVGNKPSANFSADPLDICSETPVHFTDSSSNAPIHQWFWDFGDGGTSVEQNPIHKFGDSGRFDVSLIVVSYGCADTLTKVKYVYVRPPFAHFDTTYLCSDPLTRMFVDHSLGADKWEWNFGDGDSTIGQNPKHTYAAPGTYTVVLKVSNAECENKSTKEVVVVKEAGKLVTNDSVGCLSTRIMFDVQNVDPKNIKTYSWFFNGLASSPIVTSNAPVATNFGSPGSRNSAVVINDILNCNDTLYTTVPISIYGPKAYFSAAYSGTCFGNTVHFTDSTITDNVHPIVKWTWDYGEGAREVYTAGPFSHNYTATGIYDVKMVVEDSYGCKDSSYRPAFMDISKPVAKFTPSDTLLCPNSTINFANNSTGENLKYSWNFGDGSTSAAASPQHAFAEGTFKVNLTIVDKNGCSDSASVIINSYSAKADFELSDSFSTCPPLVVNFTNKSTHFVNYAWDFGDGGGTSQLTDPSHIYTFAGTFTAKLIVRNNGGCSDSLTRQIIIKGPSGTFTYNPLVACIPANINFTATAKNTVNYIWDFSDGNTIFTSTSTASHSYKISGGYLPKLILEDAMGCKVAIPGSDTIKVKDVETHILSQTRLLCDSGIVRFSDSTISNDVITGYFWNFGDGTTSTQKNPVHNYKDTGNYTITLATNTLYGCTDTTVSNSYIKIVTSPQITIVGDTSACEPALFTLQGTYLRQDTSAVVWNWNFANGQTSNQQNPSAQTYTSAGTYVVQATATNSSGCADTKTHTLYVRPKPVVDAGIDTTICRFSPYTLHASGAATYTWNASPYLSCVNCASPVINPDSATTFYVTGQTIYGCTNTDSISVKVKQPFTMSVSKNDTLCYGSSTALLAQGAEQYSWYPSLWLSNSNIGNPLSRPDSSITYQVIGSDTHGCFADTGNVSIKVYPIPVIEITNGSTISLQVGSSVQLQTKNSADVTKWKWYPAQWLSCATCAEPKAAPKDNITYNVVASNEGNCTTKDQITINLICNNANIYIPNTFSPNGDGMNDVFYPRGTGLFTIRTFKIFNQWGQIVFERDNIDANNASQGWDGTIQGQKAMQGVYVYVVEAVCENSVVFPFKGNVTLLR